MKPEIRQAVATLDEAFSVLDFDAALLNAADMVARAAGTPLRLASKSVRIPELMHHILDLEGFRGVLAIHLRSAVTARHEPDRRHRGRLSVRPSGRASGARA